jgi:hypothetical protein
MAAAGFIAGCTAIIDGGGDWSAGDSPVSAGAQRERSEAPLEAAGGESVAVPGDGGAVEPAGGRLTAEGGSPASSAQGGDGGRPARDTSGASSGGEADVIARAGASGADGSAGEAGDRGGGASGVGGAAGAGGSGDSGVGGVPPLIVGDPAKGHQILVLDNCYRCHGDNLAGRSFYPNITPDIETGIGAWTDKQISTAIRGAIGPDGELFCAVMPLYSGFKPQEIADLIAFLRIVPAVKNSIVAVCPGHNP